MECILHPERERERERERKRERLKIGGTIKDGAKWRDAAGVLKITHAANTEIISRLLAVAVSIFGSVELCCILLFLVVLLLSFEDLFGNPLCV